MTASVVAPAIAGKDLVELEEFRSSVAVDFGQIVKGVTGASSEFDYQPINRNTVILEQYATAGEAWKLKASLMGLMWWPFNTSPSEPIHRTMRVEGRLREASASRTLGDLGALRFGFFPYKYNRDAHNLGEYLYRSGTYPGVVYTTDGYELMGRASFDAYGANLHFSHFGGLLTQEINLFAESDYAPIGDLTPAYEVAFNHPIFQIGGGMAYNRGISFQPSQLSPKTPDNTIVTIRDVVTDSLGAMDTVAITGRLSQIAPFSALDTAVLGHWTKRGVKLMARAAVDLGFILPEGLRGPQDLRFYVEAAVLGWQNQGFFYDKRSERMPIMAGVNLPAFRTLDILALQVEHYGARFDNVATYTTNSLPVWDVESFSNYDPDHYRRDDWKWSLLARRSLGSIAKIHVQVANDHLRLREFLLQQSDETLLRNPTNWYYLVRLECGI